MTDLFEIAARKKLRFPSALGALTVEQLWDLPLVVKSGHRGPAADLNSVAIAINSELKSISSESFVEVKPNPRLGELQTGLEIVKRIIAVKQEEAKAAKDAAERAEKRRKLLEALGDKEDEAIKSLSREDILKQLAEIDG